MIPNIVYYMIQIGFLTSALNIEISFFMNKVVIALVLRIVLQSKAESGWSRLLGPTRRRLCEPLIKSYIHYIVSIICEMKSFTHWLLVTRLEGKLRWSVCCLYLFQLVNVLASTIEVRFEEEVDLALWGLWVVVCEYESISGFWTHVYICLAWWGKQFWVQLLFNLL